MEDLLFTVKETAAILKVNVNTVNNIRKAGLIPFMKLGSYKCRRQAIERFLEEYEGCDLTDLRNIRKITKE